MTPIKPFGLVPGDRIGIIAPASSFEARGLKRGMNKLRWWGFEPIVPRGVLKHAKKPKENERKRRSEEKARLLVERFLPQWFDEIAPAIKSGKKVIVAAHGNSLRALVKHLDGISDEAILKLNIPTGIPLVYELDGDLKPIKHYYLGDPNAVAAALAAVANQGKAK